MKKAKKRPAKKTKKKLPAKRASMSKKDYRDALDQLGITVASQQTSKLLGIGIRHSQRMATGEVAVPRQVEMLLNLYLKHGIK